MNINTSHTRLKFAENKSINFKAKNKMKGMPLIKPINLIKVHLNRISYTNFLLTQS